jgi:DNA-directed RNA polymerase subunit alpha
MAPTPTPTPTPNEVNLADMLAAPDFTAGSALKMRRLLGTTADIRKQAKALADSFESDLAPRLPQEEAPTRRGALLWALGQTDEAEKLLNHRRQQHLACFLVALIRMDRQDFKDAAELFEQSSGTSPQPETDIIYQAECLMRMGNANEAAKAIDRAVSKAPESAYALYGQGLLAERNGEQEKALDLYEAALNVDPDLPGANFRSAFLLDLRGLDDLAARRYAKVAGGSSLHVSALTNLGLLHEENDRMDEAIACFEKALRLEPGNERIRLYLSDAVASTEMYYDEAQEKEQERIELLLRTPINDFELSVRSRNCLVRLGVKTLGEIIKHTEEELLSHKNFGETSLQEIKDLLTAKGLYLGMGRDEERRRRQRARLGPASDNPALNRPIADLGLPVRGRSCMQRLGIVTIADLVAHTEKELLSVKNFGQTSLQEVKIKLGELGVSLKAEK